MELYYHSENCLNNSLIADVIQVPHVRSFIISDVSESSYNTITQPSVEFHVDRNIYVIFNM